MISNKIGSLRGLANAGVAQRRAEKEAKAEKKRAQKEKNLSWVGKERRRVSRLLGEEFPAQCDPVLLGFSISYSHLNNSFSAGGFR